MAKKKSSKKSPQQALQDADLKHYIDTERYVKQVQAIYGKAIADLAALAVRIDGIPEDKPFEWKHNPAIAKEVEEVVHKLADRITAAVETGSRREWTAACVKSEQFIASIMKVSKLPEKTLQGYQDRNLAALDAFTQREVDGMNLSARVWRQVSSLQDEVEVIVDTTGQYKNHAINSVAAKTKMESAIGTGMSAQELSREIRSCLVEPNKLFRRVRDKYGNLHLSKAAKLYHPGQGVYRSSYKNAMRLTRSEINMAYRQSDHLRWQQLDFVTGMKIQLSNNHTCLGEDGKPHPFYDICDVLAGDYPKDFKFVGWHPQCRCYATPILRPYDEMMEDREHIDEKGYKQMPASNEVKDPPKAFNDYITGNAERIAGWKSTPYYIKDNPHWIDKALHPEKYVVQSLVLTQEQQKILDDYRMYAYNHQGSKKFAQALKDALQAQLAGDLETFEKAMMEMDRIKSKNEASRILKAEQRAAKKIDPEELAKQKALEADFATFTPEQQKNIRELEKALGQKKGLKMTFEQADTGRENPNYETFGKTPSYIKDENGRWQKNPEKDKLRGYTVNCQTCTLVHEMRRRGFNVEAISNYRRKVWKEYEANGVGSKRQGYRIGKWLDKDGKPVGPTYAHEWAAKNGVKIGSKDDVLKFFEDFSGGKDGRYEIYIDWNRSSAHVFCAERKNGKWVFFDPQTGKKDVFDGYAETAKKLLHKIGIIRTDDKLINPKLFKTFVPKGELPILAKTEEELRKERILAAAEKRHKARTKEKEEQLRKFAAEHKQKTEDAYKLMRDIMDEAGNIDEGDIRKLMHLMFGKEGTITTKAGVKVKASLERMMKEADSLKKIVTEFNNVKKIAAHLEKVLAGIKDVDTSLAVKSKSINETKEEIRKLQKAKSEIESLTELVDPYQAARDFSLAEAKKANDAIAKTMADWFKKYGYSGLEDNLGHAKAKLEHEMSLTKNNAAKYKTWKLAYDAYGKKLQYVETELSWKNMKDAYNDYLQAVPIMTPYYQKNLADLEAVVTNKTDLNLASKYITALDVEKDKIEFVVDKMQGLEPYVKASPKMVKGKLSKAHAMYADIQDAILKGDLVSAKSIIADLEQLKAKNEASKMSKAAAAKFWSGAKDAYAKVVADPTRYRAADVDALKNAIAAKDKKAAEAALKKLNMNVSNVNKTKQTAEVDSYTVSSAGKTEREYVESACGVDAVTGQDFVDAVRGFSYQWDWEIRQYQMGNRSFKSHHGHTMEQIKKKAEDCERFIDASPKWCGGTTYRGISVSKDQIAEWTGYITSKTEISMNGTASWSTKRSVSESFAGFHIGEMDARGRKQTERALFKCDDPQYGTSIMYLSRFEGEHEILCSLDCRWVIVKHEYTGGVHVFTVKPLPVR